MAQIRDFTDPELSEIQTSFSNARPFPHVVIPDFLTEDGRAAADHFPADDWDSWSGFSEGFQKAKRYCSDIDKIPENISALIGECTRPKFLTALEKMTSTEKLIVDPYLEGGGLHCSGPGGVLVPHTDFHSYEKLSLYRVLNLLIYLNKDWQEDDGGYLELYAAGERAPAVTIAPELGSAVIFKTDNASVHGFSVPVAPGRWRKSVALYYYQSRDTEAFAGDTTTYWQTQGTGLRGIRKGVFEGLTFGSQILSKMAHKMDPSR
jgi:Rps23 Pro-64 3,4-dihydroxylase Tpa1-like proline 4-hydroxylase